MVILPPPIRRRAVVDGCGQRGYDGGFGDVNNATDTAGGGDGTAAAAKCTTERAIVRHSTQKEREGESDRSITG